MNEPIKALDFLGKPLAVGNRIAYCELRYRNMIKGTIIGITPKFVKIRNGKDRSDVSSEICKQRHEQVIRIGDDD